MVGAGAQLKQICTSFSSLLITWANGEFAAIFLPEKGLAQPDTRSPSIGCWSCLLGDLVHPAHPFATGGTASILQFPRVCSARNRRWCSWAIGVDILLSYPHPSPQGSTGYSPQTQQPACPATPAGGWDGMKTNHLCGTPGLAIVTFYSGAGSVGGAFVLEWKLALLPR